MGNNSKQSNMVAIITMCFIFAMISFVTNMGAPFGKIWGIHYEWSKMLGNLMNFAAYLFMGIPAGKMLVKFGYKKTALIALVVGIAGLGLQYLSSVIPYEVVDGVATKPGIVNLITYLCGAFVCGFCVCMLNTVVNPMLNILGGGGNRGNQFIQIGGTMNSLTGTLTPLLTGAMIGTISASTSMSNVAPLLFIGMAVFAISFVIIAVVNIPEPQAEVKEKVGALSALKFRHTVLGVVAIFFYVGIEIGIPAQLDFYVTGLGFSGAAAVGGAFAALYWLLMMCGRFLSSFISGKISTKTQLMTVSAVAISLLLVGIFLGEDVTMDCKGILNAISVVTMNDSLAQMALNPVDVPMRCIFIAICGLCTSVMWGGIFNLAVEGLGKFTASASGLFMTMVVGGGIMPLIQEVIATNTSAIVSYWLVIAMLAYILFYALAGCKNVNKDIKVD